MKLNPRELLMLSVVSSESPVLISSPRSSTSQSTTSSSTSAILSTLSQESQSHSKSHPTTVSEMKSIHLDTYTSCCQTNQREISSSMLTTIRKCSDSQLDSTPEFQRISIEDSSFPSSYQTTPFQSSSLPKRTPALLKVNS